MPEHQRCRNLRGAGTSEMPEHQRGVIWRGVAGAGAIAKKLRGARAERAEELSGGSPHSARRARAAILAQRAR